MDNIGRNEQLLRIGVGSLLIGLGLARNKPLVMAGFLTVVTGIARYCPVKKIITDYKEADRARKARAYNRSALSDIPVGDMEDSGGYRTGNPVNGVSSNQYETSDRTGI